MTAYAQTNIQLYKQLGELGYARGDVVLVHRGYGLAMRLFTGLFRGSGRPFLSHLVGTASVLAVARAAIEVVTAGLLHSAYSHGEFGNYWRGPGDAKRRRLVEAVGEKVEALVFGYTRLPWTAEAIGALADGAASWTPEERQLLLMRVANEVDDHQDLGLLHVAEVEGRRAFIRSALNGCVGMAEQLGQPALGRELARVPHETLTTTVPGSLRGATDESFLLVPASHTWRPGIVSRWTLAWMSRASGRLVSGRRPGLSAAPRTSQVGRTVNPSAGRPEPNTTT